MDKTEMTKYFAYRVSATDRWGYAFYDTDKNRIGSVSFVVDKYSAAHIESKDLNWYSSFSIDSKIVPGTGRRVTDNLTGKEVYRLVFWKPGLYQVRSATDCVQVEIRGDEYLFGAPQELVTAMTKRIDTADWIPSELPGAKPVLKTTVFEDVSEAYLMMVLSFPALRFY